MDGSGSCTFAAPHRFPFSPSPGHHVIVCPLTVFKAGEFQLGGVLCALQPTTPSPPPVPPRGTFLPAPSSTKSGYAHSQEPNQSQGDANVDSSACRPAPAVSAPLCPRADRQPDGRRRLCGRDPRDPRQRARHDRRRRQRQGRAVPGLHADLEFPFGQRHAASRSSATCPPRSASARSRRCRARPSCCPASKGFSEEEAAAILGVDIR